MCLAGAILWSVQLSLSWPGLVGLVGLALGGRGFTARVAEVLPQLLPELTPRGFGKNFDVAVSQGSLQSTFHVFAQLLFILAGNPMFLISEIKGMSTPTGASGRATKLFLAASTSYGSKVSTGTE